jgi:hypothetical protein
MPLAGHSSQSIYFSQIFSFISEWNRFSHQDESRDSREGALLIQCLTCCSFWRWSICHLLRNPMNENKEREDCTRKADEFSWYESKQLRFGCQDQWIKDFSGSTFIVPSKSLLPLVSRLKSWQETTHLNQQEVSPFSLNDCFVIQISNGSFRVWTALDVFQPPLPRLIISHW